MFHISNFKIRKKIKVPHEGAKCKTQKLMIISRVACKQYELDEKKIYVIYYENILTSTSSIYNMRCCIIALCVFL